MDLSLHRVVIAATCAVAALALPGTAAGATCTVADRTATIQLDPGGEMVRLDLYAEHAPVASACGELPSSAVDAVVVEGSRGRDEVRLQGAELGTHEFRIDLGADSGDSLVLTAREGATGVAYVAGTSGVNVDGDGTVDVTLAGVDRLSLLGSPGADVLSAAGDAVTGGPLAVPTYLGGLDGDDAMSGGAGDDTFPQYDHADGADVIVGGAGTDRVQYHERRGGIRATMGTGADDGDVASGEGDDIAGDVEGVSGGAGADVFVGSDSSETFSGNGGDDVVAGAGGDDWLTGGAGQDQIDGGAGRDHVEGGSGADVIIGGADADDLDGGGGADRISGGPGGDRIVGGNGNDADILDGGSGDDVFDEISFANGSDTFVGGAGRDTVDYGKRIRAVSVTLDGLANDGARGERDDVPASIERVVGSGEDDILRSGAGAHVLEGGAGDDLIVGGGGRDELRGGAGDDVLDARDGASDVVDGGDGRDAARCDPRDRVRGVERVNRRRSAR